VPVVGRLGQDGLVEALQAAGVGLWDVIISAGRPGSLDSAIRNAEAADLASLLADLPKLKAVAFNGATAARIGRRSLGASHPGIALIDLPSSSPAHARPFEQKAASWRRLADVLAIGDHAKVTLSRRKS